MRRHGRSRAFFENQSSKAATSRFNFGVRPSLLRFDAARISDFRILPPCGLNYCRKESQKPQKIVASSLWLEIRRTCCQRYAAETFCVFCAFLRLFFLRETADFLYVQADRRTGVGARRGLARAQLEAPRRCRMRGLPLNRTRPTSFFTRAASWWCRGRARRNSSSSCWNRKF